MGLFDSLSAGLKSSLGQAAEGEIASVLPGLLSNTSFGNLSGIVSTLQQAGLGAQVQSWIGNGTNQPITANQLKAVLSNEQVQELAKRFGVDPSVALNMLAQHLPTAVDAASPTGALPPNT